MMRVCHLDTCPVGVATQNPELRERFTGKPEFVVNFFEFIAEEVREYLAELGFRSLDEVDRPRASCSTSTAPSSTGRRSGLDLTPILDGPDVRATTSRAATCAQQDHELDEHFDVRAHRARSRDRASRTAARSRSTCRSATPSAPSARCSATRSPCATARTGCRPARSSSTSPARPGSRFGAFMPRGITLRLEGDSNDYVGKGLSGGQIVVRPPRGSDLRRRAAT